MNLLLRIGFLVLILSYCSADLFQLYKITKYVTNRSPLDYVNYGCYCGVSGFGEPVDEIDKCCQQHDRCYHETKKLGNCSPKVTSYKFKLDDNKAFCTDDKNQCKFKTCECDRNVTLCFSLQTYNPKYKKNALNYYGRKRNCLKKI